MKKLILRLIGVELVEPARGVDIGTFEREFPNWRKDVASEEFYVWLSRQSRKTKLMVESDHPSDACAVMRLYDERPCLRLAAK
jgi:hypothetical protein